MNKLIVVAAVALCLCAVTAQIPISVVLEVYVDLLCPDSRDTWPTLEEVTSYYGADKLRFVVHLFSLPAIHNSFFANQGAFVVSSLASSDLFWDYADAVFAVQSEFWDQATQDETANQVIEKFGDLVEAIGIMSSNVFVASMNDTYANLAYASWQYGAARAVSGTPTFYVNGVVVGASPSWQLSDWQKILDPLFSTKKACSTSDLARHPVSQNTTCPPGETLCQYLPGQYECCFPGEFCIPNVGCTC